MNFALFGVLMTFIYANRNLYWPIFRVNAEGSKVALKTPWGQ